MGIMFYVESITIGKPSLITRFWKSLMVHFEIIGYSRAASSLAQQGLYKEAKECMAQVAKLRS
jgi:hypothetical protein